MKKLIGTSIAILSMIGTVNAQQLPLYSQYYAIPFLTNPSLAGNTDFVNASLIHKSMWKDIPGAPVTSAFTIEGPIAEKNIGLGYVPPVLAKIGTEFDIIIRGKPTKARVIKTPFYANRARGK